MFNQNFNNQYLNFQNFLNMLQIYSNIRPNLPNNFGQYYGNNNNNFGNIQTQFMFNPFNDQNVIVNGGVMPRNNNFLLKSNADLFSNYPPGPRLNIEFETGAGLKVVIPTPLNAPVYELLYKFINKVGVNPSLMGDKIFFIINGKTIPINEQSFCKDFFRIGVYGNMIKIIVIDASNVIGA